VEKFFLIFLAGCVTLRVEEVFKVDDKDILMQILGKLGGLEQRFDNLEQQVAVLQTDMNTVKSDISEIKKDAKITRKKVENATLYANAAHEDISMLHKRTEHLVKPLLLREERS